MNYVDPVSLKHSNPAHHNPRDQPHLCTICNGAPLRPKHLPCLHYFCHSCLEAYVPDKSLSVTCPTCRQTSILPEDGIEALPDHNEARLCHNEAVMNCNEALKDHDEAQNCHNEAPRMQNGNCSEYGSHNACRSLENGVMSYASSELCASHSLELSQYCKTCSRPCCVECTKTLHLDHDLVPIEENRGDVKRYLNAVVVEGRAKVTCLQDSRRKVETVSESLQSRHSEAEFQLLESFQHLSEILETRKDKLLTDLKTMYDKKQMTLKQQVADLQKMEQNLEDCCEECERSLGQDRDLVSMRLEITQKLGDLSSGKKALLPLENDFLYFFDKDIRATEKHLTNFGKVRSNSAVSFETTASGENLNQCYTNIPTGVTVTTKDCGSDIVTVGYAVIAAKMQHSKHKTSMKVEVLDNLNGTYDVIYTTSDSGPYELEILMMGQHIKGSPFHILSVPKPEGLLVQPAHPKPRAKSKTRSSKRSSSRSRGSVGRKNPLEDDLVDRIGRKGRNKGEFMNPQGVCVTDSKILVADSNNQCVQVLGKDGNVQLKFGVRGRSPGQMQRPICPAVTSHGNYLISDYDNGWVSIFNPDGKYLTKFGTGRLVGPKGVAVNKIGQIIVVDNKASSIYVFQSNGKFLHKFGTRGNADCQLAGPHYVAVGENNQIIVSDFHNHRIKVFSAGGDYLFSFGSNGEGNGQFNAPTGVCTDTGGNILVADWGNSRIQIFDSNGSFLSYINTSGDPLYGPQGITVTHDGFVIVADSGNHCIKVYKYLQ